MTTDYRKKMLHLMFHYDLYCKKNFEEYALSQGLDITLRDNGEGYADEKTRLICQGFFARGFDLRMEVFKLSDMLDDDLKAIREERKALEELKATK
ncbi:hypothetical protein [Acinetobacter pollinis]|uniref:hypothetical protein n=1 Tax=Acinetobacter pollinis TaxID=2605270 RepID=UPI0018C2294D|nr:hypothetical protein [Acinetobacter pollinis]MBF7694164.1 hypothetical protein [Acinetobacter pollinis]MBF7701761.1 hypothetical protein [Acinetobacter pollinis]